MSQHATPQNVQALAKICADASMALATATESTHNATFMLSDEGLLDATFSSMASRLDTITAMVDQFTNLDNSLKAALTPPALTS